MATILARGVALGIVGLVAACTGESGPVALPDGQGTPGVAVASVDGLAVEGAVLSDGTVYTPAALYYSSCDDKRAELDRLAALTAPSLPDFAARGEAERAVVDVYYRLAGDVTLYC